MSGQVYTEIIYEWINVSLIYVYMSSPAVAWKVTFTYAGWLKHRRHQMWCNDMTLVAYQRAVKGLC